MTVNISSETVATGFGAPTSGSELLPLFEQCGTAVAIMDADFRFQYVNGLAADLWERSHDELIGQIAWDIFADEIGTVTEICQREAMADRTVIEFEHEYSTPQKLFRIRCVPYQESGLSLFFEDITEARRSQSSLEEALRFRERLVETIADDLYLHDLPERKTTYLNGQLDAMLGYDKMRLTALSYEERRSLLYHPDDFAVLKAAAERYRILADNETMETEYRVRTADGEWRWLCSRESVFSRNDNGLPTRILGIARDVTEHHRILEISEISRARYRTLVTLLSDWIFETDTNGLYVYVSPQVMSVLGYDTSEMIGKSPLDFMPAEEAARKASMLRQIAATQTAYSVLECAYRTKSGEIVYHESGGMPIYDRQGSWIGYRGVERNITERKRYEAILAASAERQSNIAERLQRSLLLTPDVADFPHVDVITRYEPASEDELVGGDFFDSFRVDDDRIAFVVGDVTGKGLDAATETAELKFLLRSYLRETSIEAAIARLNQQILLRRRLDNRPRDVFVCLTVAILDTSSGELRMVVAGMEPPLIVRGSEGSAALRVEVVSEGGLPLGTIPQWSAEAGDVGNVTLAPGDLFLLYTDGVTEARSGSERSTAPYSERFFGTDRLVRALTNAATTTLASKLPHAASRIGDAVLSAVQRFAGVERRDDLCLLLAQYRPETPADSASSLSLHRNDAIQEEAVPMYSDSKGRSSYLRETDLQPLHDAFDHTPHSMSAGTASLTRELETAVRERESALRDREIAIREREAALKAAESSRVWQRKFLTEVLANVTEGRLRLCHLSGDLPVLLTVRREPFQLTTSESLHPLRRQVEALAHEIGLPRDRSAELLMAAGEAAMNCVVHGGGGWAILSGDANTHRVQVRITDTGKGIAEETLHRATLERGYTTAGSLGFGFSMMYAAADRVYLLTGSTGTTVVIEQNAVTPFPLEISG